MKGTRMVASRNAVQRSFSASSGRFREEISDNHTTAAEDFEVGDAMTEHEVNGGLRDFLKEPLIVRRMRMLEETKVRRRDADHIAASEGCRESVFLEWINKELQDEEACLGLPCAIGLVILFSIVILEHFGLPFRAEVRESFTEYIAQNANFAFESTGNYGAKNIHDIHIIADFWSWMRLGFVPVVLGDRYLYSEANFPGDEPKGAINPNLSTKVTFDDYGTRETPKVSDWMQYNHILTDIRITQKTVQPVKCDMFPDELGNPLGDTLTPCYTRQVYKWFSSRDLEQLRYSVLIDNSADRSDDTTGMQRKYLKLTDSTYQIERQLRQWEEMLWIQQNVYKIEVQFVVLNREYGLWSLVTVHLIFYRGGSIGKYITVSSHWLNYAGFYKDRAWLTFTWDVSWVLCNLWIFFAELGEMRDTYLYYGSPKVFFRNYFNVWNVIDWLTLAAFSVVMVFYIRWTIALDDLTASFGTADSDKLFDMSEKNLELYLNMQYVCLLYLIVGILRLFKGFEAQPRLGLVTSTLVKASTDLAHFIIVFGCVFSAYAVAGVLMFGENMREYETFLRACMTCWRMVMGDLDFDRLRAVNWTGSFLYVVSFSILIVLIMLNMMLAIILETYLEVKRERTEKAETLGSQALESFGRYVRKKRRERIGLDIIRDKMLSSARRRIIVRRELEKRHAESILEEEEYGGELDDAIPEGLMQPSKFIKLLMWNKSEESLESSLYIPKDVVIKFIEAEGRYLTAKKLKAMVPEVPLSQANRIIRTALCDCAEVAMERSVEIDTAVETLYNLLQDENVDLSDRFSRLERKFDLNIDTLKRGIEGLATKVVSGGGSSCGARGGLLASADGMSLDRDALSRSAELEDLVQKQQELLESNAIEMAKMRNALERLMQEPLTPKGYESHWKASGGKSKSSKASRLSDIPSRPQAGQTGDRNQTDGSASSSSHHNEKKMGNMCGMLCQARDMANAEVIDLSNLTDENE